MSPRTPTKRAARLPDLGILALQSFSSTAGTLPGPLTRLAARLAGALRARRERALAAGGDPSLVRIEGVTLRIPLPLAVAFLDRRFDPLTITRVRQLLHPGMLVVDVGAHVGFYSLLFARYVGSSGHVLALEPAPENASLLRRNVEEAGTDQVEVVQVAAGESEGERELCLTTSSDTHSFYIHPLISATGTVRVPARRLDRLLSSPPDLVKVDVEGAELEVLRGMAGIQDTIRPRALVLEVNPACLSAAGTSALEILAWLDRHGYRQRELIDEQAGVTHRGVAECDAAIAVAHPADWFANLIALRS